jgi:hypothetical protein
MQQGPWRVIRERVAFGIGIRKLEQVHAQAHEKFMRLSMKAVDQGSD